MQFKSLPSKFNKLTCISAYIALLSACGGGGPSNENPNTVPATNTAPLTPETPKAEEDTSNPLFDLTTRTGSQAYYEKAYLPDNITGSNDWLGNNINNCNPGQLTIEQQQKALNRINYYRHLIGSTSTQVDASMNNKAQQAAYVAQLQYNTGNNLTSSFHNPRQKDGRLLDWPCLNNEAAEAFSKGNIAQHPTSLNIVFSVNLFIWDPGTNNTSAGHRDGLFKNNLSHVGIGASSEAAVIMMKNTGNNAGSWSWPPANIYVPSTVLSPRAFGLPRWSVRNEKAWIRRANQPSNENVMPSVHITDCNHSSLPISNIKIADNKLLTWEVDLNYADITDECAFNVRIDQYYMTENEGDGAASGSLKTIKYTTTIFNPEQK